MELSFTNSLKMGQENTKMKHNWKLCRYPKYLKLVCSTDVITGWHILLTEQQRCKD